MRGAWICDLLVHQVLLDVVLFVVRERGLSLDLVQRVGFAVVVLLEQVGVGGKHLHYGSEVVLIDARTNINQGCVEIELDANGHHLALIESHYVQVNDELLQSLQFALLLEVGEDVLQSLSGDEVDLVA